LQTTQISEWCFSRGFAARCAEAAMPFRKGSASILGYARNASGSSNKALNYDNFQRAKLSGVAQYKIPGLPEGHSRFRTSGGKAGERHGSEICIDADE
jgi:hypothetical protein